MSLENQEMSVIKDTQDSMLIEELKEREDLKEIEEQKEREEVMVTLVSQGILVILDSKDLKENLENQEMLVLQEEMVSLEVMA